MLRRTVIAASAVAFMFLTTGAAHAGGSWLEPSWVRVEPGDEVNLTATVYRGALGWVDDGPFYTYLRGESFGSAVKEGYGGTATDVALGRLEIREQDQTLTVHTAAVIPSDTPPGEYWITVCNDPCTTGLGDLVGGVLYVGVDPPEDTAAAEVLNTNESASGENGPTRLAIAPYPDRSPNLSPLWVGFLVALGGGALLMTLFGRDRA